MQPIYYPFMHMANYGAGKVLQGVDEIPAYDCDLRKQVPFVDYVAVHNEGKKEVVLFAVNRMEHEAVEITLELQEFQVAGVIEHVVMHSDDKKATNLKNHDLVRPGQTDGSRLEGNSVISSLPTLSWNMVRIALL